MNLSRRFLFGAFLLGLAATSHAENWPSRSIRFIVGYPAGSSPDMQARVLAEPLSKALGQPVVVENKPGASGNLGAEALAHATDGHTIAIIGNGPLTTSKYLYSRLGYDAAKDFAPVALVASGPLVLVTPKSLGLDGADKLIRFAREQGDKMAYGSSGPGSGTHLAMELIKQSFKWKALHVPYTGAPPVITALVGGQLQMALLPPSTVMPLVQSGKLDALAVSSATQSPLAPGLPSMQDLGVRNVNVEVWNAVMAPASMPSAHRTRLTSELQKILGTREMRESLLKQGWQVQDTSPQAVMQRMRDDSIVYRDVIERNHIRLD